MSEDGQRPNVADLKIDRSDDGGGGSSRRALVIAAAVLALVAAATVFLAMRSRPVSVATATIRPAPVSGSATVLNASGYVEPRRRATVAAKITGRVTEVLVEEGMRVEAGQVLARLDDSDTRRRLQVSRADREVARANIAELEVSLVDARRTLRRIRELSEQGVAGQQELDTADTSVETVMARLAVARRNLEAAEAQVAVIEQDLENYTIRAPFSGVAVSKDAQPGEMVSPVSAGGGYTRTGISTIVDMTSLEIEVDVNESFIARVRSGQRVEAILDAYPEWRIPASVRTVIPTADRQKATVKVRISFNELDPRILPDMGVKVAFLETEPEEGDDRPRPRALAPADALRLDGETAVVFVVQGDVAERRAVTVGRTVGTEAEILGGLTGGEQVIVGNLDGLADGQEVRVSN